MSLARQYRLKFAAKRSDRLILYLATAVAIHIGIAVAAPESWQVGVLPVAPEVNPAPIDFVYLDTATTNELVDAQRHASVNATAGGTADPKRLVDAGKLGVANQGSASATEAEKPIAPGSATVPYVPISSPESNGEKAVEPEADDKASTDDQVEGGEPAIAPSLPVLPSTSPSVSPQPPSSANPDKLEPTGLPSPGLSPVPIAPTPQPIPSPTPTVSSTLAPNRPPTTVGQGLDGISNPNRTASGEAGIDAQQDDLWGPYVAELNRAVYERWQRLTPDTTRETKLRFTIDRQGQLISSIELVQSSGSNVADQLAIDAIQRTAPFNPLPAAAPEPMLTVNFTFTHAVLSPPL